MREHYIRSLENGKAIVKPLLALYIQGFPNESASTSYPETGMGSCGC